MIMIDKLIRDELDSRATDKTYDCELRTQEVYRHNPELLELDNKIVNIRTNAMLDYISGKSSDPVASEISGLQDKRTVYLREHKIAPDFDSPKVICNKCNDTGYRNNGRTRQVCDCMSQVLEECYRKSGMKDYETVNPSNYRNDYLSASDNQHRQKVQTEIGNIISRVRNRDRERNYIYSAGAGKGKTFLSVCMCKASIMFGLNGVYIKCENLENLNGSAKIDELKSVDILFIDDFYSSLTGVGKIVRPLLSILEARENRGLATIIVSREAKEELISESDERIAVKLRRAVYI